MSISEGAIFWVALPSPDSTLDKPTKQMPACTRPQHSAAGDQKVLTVSCAVQLVGSKQSNEQAGNLQTLVHQQQAKPCQTKG